MSGLAYSSKTVRRFWEKVDRSAGPDACWPFTGAKNDKGYGVFFVGEGDGPANAIASRFAFTIERREPGDDRVCHRCDNPACCNPAHLFAGSQADNIADMWAKDRQSPPPHPRGADNRASKLTDDAVLAIRSARARGVSIKALAAANDVSEATIKRAASGRSWAHVRGAA